MASATAARVALEETSQQNAVSLEVESITIPDEQIAQRAYKIWEREGKIDGRDQEHWFQAIAEVTSEVGDEDEKEGDVAFCIAPTVRTPRATSAARRSHYSV